MDQEIGDKIAARLKEGSRDDYDMLQAFVRNAVERQEWLYADMIMRIFWALLPAEAQEKISRPEPVMREEPKTQEQPPPVPKVCF